VVEIKRLVTFGCSNTYGHGLADCYNSNGTPGPNPSIQAWPFLFAQKYKLGVSNEAEPGISNKQIYKKILEYSFRKGDLVIVLWSYINRHCIFYPTHTDPIGPWINSTRSKKYQELIFNDYDATWHLTQMVDHVNKLLKNRNIFHYYMDWYMDKAILDPTAIKNKMFIHSSDWRDTARDNKHPGRQTQLDFLHHIEQDTTGPAVALSTNTVPN